jgi:hypothetical protein
MNAEPAESFLQGHATRLARSPSVMAMSCAMVGGRQMTPPSSQNRCSRERQIASKATPEPRATSVLQNPPDAHTHIMAA